MRFLVGFFRLIISLIVLESAFVVHEYGHLVEFQKRGIPVEEFSIGIGWSLYQYRSREFLISFRTIPIAAYVAPTAEGAKLIENKLSFKDRFIIYSAGVRNNILTALIFIFYFQILGWKRGNLTSEELVKTMFFTPIKVVLRFFALLLDIFTLGLNNFGRKFCLSTGGIIPPKRPRQLIFFNLSLGLLNLAPFLPLDGGKIAQDMLAPLGITSIIEKYPFLMLTVFIIFYFVVNTLDWTLLEIDLKKENS